MRRCALAMMLLVLLSGMSLHAGSLRPAGKRDVSREEQGAVVTTPAALPSAMPIIKDNSNEEANEPFANPQAQAFLAPNPSSGRISSGKTAATQPPSRVSVLTKYIKNIIALQTLP